jgi:hypothetical protein
LRGPARSYEKIQFCEGRRLAIEAVEDERSTGGERRVREVKENIDAREDEAVKVEDCEKGREVGRLTGHAEPMDVDLKSRLSMRSCGSRIGCLVNVLISPECDESISRFLTNLNSLTLLSSTFLSPPTLHAIPPLGPDVFAAPA